MNTTMPAPTPIQPATTSSASQTAPAAGAEGDFLLMLGQLLGVPVAQASNAAKAAASTVDTEADASEALPDAAALAGLPLPVLALPDQPRPMASGAAADGLMSTELSSPIAGASSATSAAARESIAASLMDVLGRSEPEAATGSSAFNAQPVQLPDTSQQLRAAAAIEVPVQRPLHNSVGNAAWADELGTRMIMMTERGQHSASLRLSPEHLGPLEVRIAIRDDQASVWFGAAHADTRAAIEQALPRLRELFASQGLGLADAGVYHEAFREQPRSSPTPSSVAADPSLDADPEAGAARVRLGLVDAYA
jgi:flagellar hook-length control protein FliK